MKVVVTGANGFIGKSIVNYLKDKGALLNAFQRQPGSVEIENLKYTAYELSNPVSEAHFDGYDILIHCAYQPVIELAKGEEDVNIKGTLRLIEICKKLNIKFVYLSSLSAHANAESNYGKHKFFIENQLSGVDHAVLKLGMVIGNGGVFEKILTIIKSSSFIPLISGGKQPVQCVGIDDVCQIIEKVITNRLSGVFYIGNEPVSLKGFYLAVAESLNKRIRFVNIPFNLIWWIVKTGDLLKISLPVSTENLLGLKMQRIYKTEESLQKIGVKLKTMQYLLSAKSGREL